MTSAAFCIDQHPDMGSAVFYNAAVAAGWYSAVCAILATAALIGVQLRLNSTDRSKDRPAVLALSSTFVVALLGAFANAEASGEVECNAMTSHLTIAGSFIASAAMLLVLSLAWTIAELQVGALALRLFHILLGLVVVAALTYNFEAIAYQDDLILNRSTDVFSWDGALLAGPPVAAVSTAIFMRVARRNIRASADEVLRRRSVQILCSIVLFGHVAALVAADVYIVGLDVEEAQAADFAPRWTAWSSVWGVGFLGALVILAAPWRRALPPASHALPPPATQRPGSLEKRAWIEISIGRRR